MKKEDKHSDSESELPCSADGTQWKKHGNRPSIAKSYDVARGNPKVFARLLAFGGLLFVTFATRFYAIAEPGHIW